MAPGDLDDGEEMLLSGNLQEAGVLADELAAELVVV